MRWTRLTTLTGQNFDGARMEYKRLIWTTIIGRLKHRTWLVRYTIILIARETILIGANVVIILVVYVVMWWVSI